MSLPKTNNLNRVLSFTVAGIFVLLPFHALLTTWLGSNLGHLDLFRIWKELLLVPLGVGALYIGAKNLKTRRWLKSSPLFYAILAYVVLEIVIGLVALRGNYVNGNALIYGLLNSTRFLVFFVICFLVSANSSWLKNHWRPILLWPALIVISFGLLQHFVLPANYLRHFGYGPNTIITHQTVDLKPQYVRVQSTLRGPNPLGAYLVLVASAIFMLLLKDKRGRKYWAYVLGATLVVLFFTYSRSAWLGTSLALALIGWWQLKNKKWRMRILAILGVLLIVGAVGTLALRDNDSFQNIFFHTDEHSRSADSSNYDRASALKNGAKDVWHDPLGRGPGTAGPASVRNDRGARIAENYYIQIAQEVGVVGLVLFVLINVFIALGLWKQHDQLSLILLATLIGVTLVNMLSHGWADDTLSLVFFGLAGLSLGSHWPAHPDKSG